MDDSAEDYVLDDDRDWACCSRCDDPACTSCPCCGAPYCDQHYRNHVASAQEMSACQREWGTY